jgi:CRP-like cAMP-binding protein
VLTIRVQQDCSHCVNLSFARTENFALHISSLSRAIIWLAAFAKSVRHRTHSPHSPPKGMISSSGSRSFPFGENRILAALPPLERQQLFEVVRNVTLPVKTVLFEPDTTVDAVHFPTDGVISLVTPLHDGAIVEVATIGNEGIVGVPLVPFGGLAVRAISQVAGHCLRMEATVFLEWTGRSQTFQTLIESYTQALFGQISQAAACNRLHSSEERLSRWLLMSHDRVGSDEFMITQEFLGQMLAARRSTVSVSAGILQRAGLIRYVRGHVTIVDRYGLEAVACECYAVIKAELERVVQKPAGPGEGATS